MASPTILQEGGREKRFTIGFTRGIE